jgi:hypothetical protein
LSIKLFWIKADNSINSKAEEDSSMDISGISGLNIQGSDLLTQRQEQQQEQLASNANLTSMLASTLQTDYVNISSAGYDKSQNMMAGNFVGGATTDSTYVDAQLSALATEKSLKNSMNDAVESSMESTIEEAAFWYGSKQMRNAKMLKDATESNQQVFSDIRDNIDEKAAEAIAPKDENGDPIEQGSTAGSTGTAQAPDVSVASDAGAQAADAASAAADGSVPPDGEAQAAAAVPSISIKV